MIEIAGREECLDNILETFDQPLSSKKYFAGKYVFINHVTVCNFIYTYWYIVSYFRPHLACSINVLFGFIKHTDIYVRESLH